VLEKYKKARPDSTTTKHALTAGMGTVWCAQATKETKMADIEEQQFEVPEEMMTRWFLPFMKELEKKLRQSVVGFFRFLAKERCFAGQQGEYILFDFSNYTMEGAPEFEQFLIEQFVQGMGVRPGEHTVEETEALMNGFLDALRDYYTTNTDTLGRYGSVYMKGDQLVLMVNEDEAREPGEHPKTIRTGISSKHVHKR
jgi:hypothetical protein